MQKSGIEFCLISWEFNGVFKRSPFVKAYGISAINYKKKNSEQENIVSKK